MKLFHTILTILLFALSAQTQAAATLDPNTLQLDIPYLLYQSEQGDVPVWVRLQFVPNSEGRLLWQVIDYGAATTPRRLERAGERPVGTVSGDLQFLELPDINFNGAPLAATLTNVPSQDDSIIYELRSYQIWTDTTYSAQGTDITDPNTGIRVKSVDGEPFYLKVSVVLDEDNDRTVRLDFINYTETSTRSMDIYLPQLGSIAADNRDDSIAHLWSQSGLKYFMHTGIIETNRLPEAKQQQFRITLKYVQVVGISWQASSFLHAKLPSKLYGYCSDGNTACYQGKTPVLFVHGYTPATSTSEKLGIGGFGGGDDTWGNFPQLLADKYAPFEFVWRTNARFEDVANDLGQAVKLIQQKTGKPVYIIAHSFGGLLARAWLQGLASDSATPSASGLVAGLTTLGTPHSGIADKNRCMAGIALPGGQDGIDWFEGCQQASCELAGEEIFSDAMRNLFGSGVGKPMRPGELIQKLNDFNTYPLPSIDILVQIGLTSQRGFDAFVDVGDGLITYEGQRFAPSDTVQGSCFENQGSVTARDSSLRLSAVNTGGARVMETFLGFPDTWRPGEFNLYANDGFYGYKHAKLVSGSPRMEAYVDCISADNCDHHGFQYTLAWLNSLNNTTQPPVTPPTTSKLNDTGITWGGGYSSGNNSTCIGETISQQDCSHGRDVTHNDDSDGHAGFSFTKIDGGNCVQDNVTGLMWEVKQGGNGTRGDEGLHDADDAYNWYDTNSATNGGADGYADDDGNICYGYQSGNPSTYCNTQAYVARVNAAGWCGYNDWRMPNREELRSIVDYSTTNPAIDTTYFPNTQSSWYWSGSPHASYSNGAWVVGFNYGSDDYNHRNSYRHVRLVRGGQ
jgi:pimeloyl-ACP methyl ester carboxylesterase